MRPGSADGNSAAHDAAVSGSSSPDGKLRSAIGVVTRQVSAAYRFRCWQSSVVRDRFYVNPGQAFATVINSSLAEALRDRYVLEHCILVSADRITRVGRDPVYGKGRINVLGGAECRRLK